MPFDNFRLILLGRQDYPGEIAHLYESLNRHISNVMPGLPTLYG